MSTTPDTSVRFAGNPKRLICIMFLQSIVLLWICWGTAPGFDEWGHLPSGLYHLQFGKFEPYRVNPPLVRSIAAVPVLAMGGGVDWLEYSDNPGDRQEWQLMDRYIQKYRSGCFRFFSIARMAVLPFPLLGTYLIWILMRRWSGERNAIIASTLWAFSPTVLTFGASITPDVPTAVLGLLATMLFWSWIKNTNWLNFFAWCLALGFAMLCKTTWITLPPMLIATWVVCRATQPERNIVAIGKECAQIALGAAIVLLMLNTAYEFQGTMTPLGEFHFVSKTLRATDQTNRNTEIPVDNRFRETWAGCIPVPLPKDYILGIDIQKSDFESKMPSYLLGEWRDRGWWYYYIIAMLIKEPLALWILVLVTVIQKMRFTEFSVTAEEAAICIPGIAILVFVSSQTGFNHHLRYVLPFFPVLFIFAARGSRSDAAGIDRLKVILTAWFVASSLSVLPRSYAFFSEAVGGPYNGWRYIGDSNLDWGQDLLTLREWLKKEPQATPPFVLYSIWYAHVNLLVDDVLRGEDHLGQQSESGARIPAKPGRWIVFARPLISPEGRWFQGRTPSRYLSPTIRIYDLSEADIREIAHDNNEIVE